LSRAGHKVTYLTGETKLDGWAGGRVFSMSKNINIMFNGNKLTIPAYSRSADIKQRLAAERFDVLHVMTPYSPIMSQRVINRAPQSIAIVGTFHVYPRGLASRAGARLLRAVYGRSLNRLMTMISVSRPAADFCRQSLGVASEIIPNPLDFTPYKQTSAALSEDKRIVFLGRLVKRKGAEELLKAFAIVSVADPEARLIIAGDGPQRQKLQRMAKELNINHKTTFLGRIEESEKPALLASAAVACFPSLYGESFGIVLVEAMAAGATTILAGDNPGYRSVLGEQPLCLVDPRDTLTFVERLQQLLNDRSSSHKISKWQRQAVKQYDVEVVGPQVLSVYRSAIARLAKNSHNKRYE